MAGIGEASAILAVAHIGISLSNTLIAYVSEVQDAPFRIQRIGNEVLTTSERLKDIGELVETNGKTQTLSNEGVQSAVRCSADCENILNQLQGVLKKGGWQQRSDRQENEEIDTSLFSSLRWPFSKTKLEVPLAELTRVKLDLMLLFSSAMALGASSISEKAKFRKDIPGLSRTREWAARMAEQAKERAKDREYNPYFRDLNLQFPQGEPEMLQDFVDFQEGREREQEEQKLAERAARLLIEQEASKKKAEEERRELEEEILNKHKMDQMVMEARTAQQKQDLRIELEAAGLEQEQINIVLASSQLNYGETTGRPNLPADRPMNGTETSDNNKKGTERTTGERSDLLKSHKHRKWRLKLSWSRPTISRSETFSLNSKSHLETRAEDWLDCEAWVVDAYSGTFIHFPSSDEWLAAKIDKALNEGGAWRDFARLNERLRTELMRFLRNRKRNWSLVLIDTRNILGIRGLRSIRHNGWVRFVISPPRSNRSTATATEDGVESEKNDQEDINTRLKHPARQVHAPTAHDVMLGVENGHNGERERTGFRGEDDNVWEPPGGERNPHNRGPPPPPPTFGPYNYGPPPPRSTHIDHNHYPSQNQQLVIRDTSQQLARRSFERSRPPPPTFIPPPRRDLPNESNRRTWNPPREVGAKLSPVGQERPPHYYSSDSDWEISFSRRPTTVSLDPYTSNKERALVRRSGGSPRVESYMREPVLNDSTRVRGEDVSDAPVVVDGRTKRLSMLETTKPQDQDRRHKVPAKQRLQRNKHETSEEEDYIPDSKPPRHAGSEAKLTDEEVILKTLKKFTTFQGEVNPSSSGDIAINSASPTPPYRRRESTVESRRASNDTVRSSWPAAAKERHGRLRDLSPAATADLEKEQKRPWEQNREQESALERRFTLYDRDTGVISDEPTAMYGEDELIDVLESNAAKPLNELAHKSSAANPASVHHDTATNSFSGPEPNDEITSQSHRRARFQEDEGLARDTRKNLIKRSATEPISKANPSISRSATVEDFGPEGENR